MARVIRGALRLRTEIVALVEPPVGTGQHLLALEIPGEGSISLLAEPAGAARPEGYPLSLRPVTRVQMAELFALVERLDDPYSEPPPPAGDTPDSEYPFAQGSDDTMIDGMPSRVVLPNATFGVIESMPQRQFQVAGHTDDVPIHNDRFGSNCELSAGRALRVVHFLVSDGAGAKSLSAAGYSETDPIAANKTPEGRKQNRRTEITLQPNIDELVNVP